MKDTFDHGFIFVTFVYLLPCMSGQTRRFEFWLHFLAVIWAEKNATELEGISSDGPNTRYCGKRSELMWTAFWLMVAIVGTAVFAFITLVVWLGNREKERKTHYRGEMARRIVEADDAGPVLEYVRETERTDAARTGWKARMAGLITMAVGVALMIFLYQAMPGSPGYLVGLIPGLVGVVLLLGAGLMMRPTD
jgi:hypothetical protein